MHGRILIFMEHKELTTMQKTSLEILKIFMEICEKYNLKYYIGGGTMLGAIRHKGFIPWDDDIDIDMPRKDFQKFLNIFDTVKKLYPDYEIERRLCLFTKLVDTRTKVKYFADTAFEISRPIWIDIVPIDGLPNNVIRRNIHLLKISLLKEAYHLSVIKYSGVKPNSLKQDRSCFKKFVVTLCMHLPVEKIFNYKTCTKKLERELIKYSFYDCKYAGTLFSNHGKRSVFLTEWYGEGTKYQFEDIEVTGVDNYDAWLTHLYGDYMKLPDEKHRLSHHGTKIIEAEK